MAGAHSGIHGLSAGAQLYGLQLVFGLQGTFGVHALGVQGPIATAGVTNFIFGFSSLSVFIIYHPLRYNIFYYRF